MLIEMLAAAPGFDVEAATRAYLDTLQGAARAKSDSYFEGGYWLLLWNALVGIAAAWAVLRLGWSAAWRRWAERITRWRWLQAMLYAVPWTIVSALIVLPWTIYTGWYREKQYDLMNLSLGAWLGEQAIGLAISTLFLAILLAIVFTLIRRMPRSWWIWSTGAITLLIAIAVAVGPVFISPLFNDYKPMAAGPVRDKILAMARANRVPADNVYVFDQSKQTKRISANVSGLGPTIRISLNDNLLNRTSPAEVKAVMGHELGHYVLNHIAKSIALTALIVALGLFLLWRLTPAVLARWGTRWGVTGPDDPAATPVYVILTTLYLLAMTPALNSITRIMESEADAFGLDAAREPDGFALTAMKLSEYRKIEPGALEEMIFFDHPSGRTRVHMAMAWKANHLAEQKAKQPPPSQEPSASEAR
jgi:STE24 endopeptidase